MKIKLQTCLVLAAAAALVVGNSQARAQQPEIRGPQDQVLEDHGIVVHRTRLDVSANANAKSAGKGGRPNRNTITYHNGPVILGTVNVYVIWYGNWNNNSATVIIPDFLNNIGGSPYYKINTTYFNGSGNHLANSVEFLGDTFDSYSQGSSLSDAQIKTVVASAISSGRLPKDANAVYFVLTSADVTASSGFCTKYCGWHTYGSISGSTIKYSFVGNPDRCPSACSPQSPGPNGNAGADAMVSIIAHELEEAASDPQLNAWYDGFGAENADKCAWSFGTSSYATPNGAMANVHLGNRDYLIQQNWVNAGSGYCALQY